MRPRNDKENEMAKVGVGGKAKVGAGPKKLYKDLVTGRTYTIDQLVRMRNNYRSRMKKNK